MAGHVLHGAGCFLIWAIKGQRGTTATAPQSAAIRHVIILHRNREGSQAGGDAGAREGESDPCV